MSSDYLNQCNIGSCKHQSATSPKSFESKDFKDKLLSFLAKSRPYMRLKEFDQLLFNLHGLPRTEVISLFAVVSHQLFIRNISVKKMYKLSAAWIYCTSTTHIKKYPNLGNEKLLIWCYTGLFKNLNFALKYLLYLLKKDFLGNNYISQFYKKLQNKYIAIDDLIDMIPKIQVNGSCDRVICHLVNLFANIFKQYNTFVYDRDCTINLNDIHSKLTLRLAAECCSCWNKLILSLIKIHLSMGEDISECYDKFGIIYGKLNYFNNIIKMHSYITPPDLKVADLKQVKRLIRYNKDWKVLLGGGNDIIEGQINDILLARNTLFTLQSLDIFDKDEWVAIGIWSIALISGNHIVRSTNTKIVINIPELENTISEASLDQLLFNILLKILHYVYDKLHVLSHNYMITSFIAFLLFGLSHYWQMIEHSDSEIVGKILLHFIPSITINGDYLYSQINAILKPVEMLVKSALKISLPEYILEATFLFIQVRPTDLSKGESHLQSMAYHMFIYSNILPNGPRQNFKAFVSYLVRWATFLSRFNEFTIYQIRLMSAILSNILLLILKNGKTKGESIISLINVIFTAFISNPALESIWNKRGRRIESGELQVEIYRFLTLTCIIYPKEPANSSDNLGFNINYCARQTIKGFIAKLLKLLPIESRRSSKFSALYSVFETEDCQPAEYIDKKIACNITQPVAVGDRRRKYNYHFKANDDFIDFDTDRHLGMLLVRDDLGGEIQVRPEWKYLIGSILY